MASADPFTELPATYKAVVYDKPGEISTKVVDLAMPEPLTGQVLIKISHSGVCHTDLGIMKHTWATLPFPVKSDQVGGHEGVGQVVKLGPETESISTVKVGDRVGIKWMAGVCETCEACRAGMDAQCFKGKISGYYTPGTFQQYVLAPANYVTPIPDALDSAVAAPLLCAGVTVYSALRKADVQSGKWVVILGAGGGLGHLAVQYSAKAIGHRVIGVDHSRKKDIVMSGGAEHFIPMDGTDSMAQAVKELTDNLGAHAVVVCTAHPAAYAQSMELLRFGGCMVCVGMTEGEPIPIKSAHPNLMVAKGARIIGSAVGNRQEAIEALEFGARGIVKAHVRIEKMDKLTSVFEEMAAGTLSGRVVLDLS